VPDHLHLLLDVQDHDLSTDQLRHRRASLPQRLALAEQDASVVRLDAELGELGARVAELQRAQKRLEDEIATIEAKGESEQKRLYSGAVTSPRELQALQEEIDALTRRQRGLEDELLDILEALEPLLDEVDGLESRRDALLAEGDSLRRDLAEAEAAVDAELDSVARERAALVAQLPDDLLATYERLRPRLGGVAVARLDGTQCQGCHLSLPATELDAVRHADPNAVVMHEECGRILVRS
jgi:predicted  nucleic acid-binding Zn-ribbon protein